jgi:hypothetical protein
MLIAPEPDARGIGALAHNLHAVNAPLDLLTVV